MRSFSHIYSLLLRIEEDLELRGLQEMRVKIQVFL